MEVYPITVTWCSVRKQKRIHQRFFQPMVGTNGRQTLTSLLDDNIVVILFTTFGMCRIDDHSEFIIQSNDTGVFIWITVCSRVPFCSYWNVFREDEVHVVVISHVIVCLLISGVDGVVVTDPSM